MYVLKTKPEVAILLHPKTASRSIEDALRKQLPKKVTYTNAGGGRHHLHEKRAERILRDGGLVVATVRHPLDTIVSWRHFLAVKDIAPWDEWVDQFLAGKASGYVRKRIFYAAPFMNWTLRYESGPEEEYNKLMDHLELPRVKLKHMGKAEDRRDWRGYFTEEQKRKIYDRFPHDFEEFGYSIED